MTKAARFENLTPCDVLQAMTPGEQYTLHEITRRSGVGLSSTRALLASSIAEGLLRTGLVRQRTVYWRPSEVELARERLSVEEAQQTRAVLKGYDALLRRQQELSMLARPRPAAR